jgi:hypothetical protein
VTRQAARGDSGLTGAYGVQVELGRRTMELLRRQEARREPSSTPSRNEEVHRRKLNDGLDQLRQELGAATLQRKLQQLEELMAEVRMQDRKRLKQVCAWSSRTPPCAAALAPYLAQPIGRFNCTPRMH